MDKKLMISDEFIEELRAIFVESEFNSRWELIRGYHEAGKLLQGIPTNQLQRIAERLGRSERTLYYAVKFYKIYPDLNALPEGKNVSMRKIIREHLTEPSEKIEVPRIEIFKHECGKYQVKYREESICSCNGEFHLTNLSLLDNI